MAVYVDDMNAPFMNMIMSHMIADTKEELFEMTDKIGVQRKWIQKENTPYEHFDIALSKKALAIKNGAILITWRELAMIIKKRKDMLTIENLSNYKPGEVFAKGDIENSPEGIYMTSTRIGDVLTWVAVKGGGDDWAVYCYWKGSTEMYIRTNGQKVEDLSNVKKLVPCNDEVLKRYRR